jgi:PKD repeat protein
VPPPTGCHSNFKYDSISGLNYQFTDLSEGSSTITSWRWNFGDPASGVNNLSVTQDPQHLYSGSGIYNVKLTIQSLTGCRDSIIRTVFIQVPLNQVNITGHVLGDSTGVPIADYPVMINAALIEYSKVVYSDQNGLYGDTLQGVPDGIPISVASYDCNNILHSNTVYSSSIPIQVDFHLCVNTRCYAGFSFELDSNNSVHNTFLFTDQSYGDPNHWSWSFGDGNSGTEKNPSHQYALPGTYRVLLTITREDSLGTWICSDTISQLVSTPSYFNIGGLLFIGQFPINNPHSTGDTGIVFLYRKHNQWIVPVDTAHFTFLGYYTFLNVLEGNYIIKAGLTGGSAHYSEFIPVYSGDNAKWQTSVPFTLNQNSFYNDLHLIPANDSLTGSAILKGSVVHMDDYQKLCSAEVLLYSEEMNPVRSVLTDPEGAFEIGGLPYGTYYLYPEITGKFARLLMVTVDSNNQIISDIQLDVYDNELTGTIPNPGKTGSLVGNIYPNPGTDVFHFTMGSPAAMNIRIELYSCTGMKLSVKSYVINQGRNILSMPLHDIVNGLYFMVVRKEDGKIINTQKLIKN